MENNPNQPPQNPQQQRELTEKALNTKYSYMFSRKQVLILRTLILRQQYNLADAKELISIVEEIESKAITSLNDSDYEKPVKANNAETNHVKKEVSIN